MARAPASGIRLSAADAAIVKAMLDRGDRQHDIAAWFGVNSGRIASIALGGRFREVEPATGNLPPPGPYLAGRDAHAAMFALEEAGRTINAALALIRERAEAAEAAARGPSLVPDEELA
jgi:hypothetical protein